MNYSGLPERQKWLVQVVALAVGYYLAARAGLLLAFAATNASPVWPPSGIALAALLLLGYRIWPGIFLGALAANLTVFAANKVAAGTTIAAVSSVIAVGNTLEALFGAYLLRRLIGARPPFDQPQDVFRFALVTLCACAIGASVGALALLQGGIAAAAAQGTVWLTWWVGDAAGMLLVTPVLLTALRPSAAAGEHRSRLEIVFSLALLIVVGVGIFSGLWLAEGGDRPLAYLVILCLAWSAYRHGARGVALASLIVAGMAVLGTTHGFGPFAKGSLNDGLIVLESFFGLCSVTGLVLAADLTERRRLAGALTGRDIAAPWVTLLACLGVTMLAWHFIASATERRARDRFNFLAESISSRIAERMLAYEQVLRGGAGLFAVSQSVGRNEWRDYVRKLRIEENVPGIQGIAYAQRIMPEEKDAHIRQVQAEGFPGYSIRPHGERAEYSSIVYMEPFTERNLRAFGYDMLTEPVRRAAMLQARDSGDTAVSGKVTLVQETTQDVQAGFVMYLPVYRKGAPSGTVGERRAALAGYVASAFRMNDLMRGILGSAAGSAAQPLAVEIFDGRETAAAALMYDSEAGRPAAPTGVAATFTAQSPLKIEDRDWMLRFTVLPAFEAGSDRQTAQIVLVGGIIVSLLFFTLVRSLAATREKALVLAREMTAAMRESEAKFTSLAEPANEAVVIADAQGKVVSWNRGAEAIFGHSEAEILGQELTRLMPERFREQHRDGLMRMQATGTARIIGKTVALTGLAKDGREFPIELSLATWGAGAARFYSGIIRNTTEQKRTWQALMESRDRLDLAMGGSRLALFEWNIAAGDVYLSEEWATFIGAPPGPTYTSFAELNQLVHPDDRARQRLHIQNALKGNTEFYRTEHRVRTRSGQWKWIQSHGKVVERDASGRALKLIGTNADIDYRKEIEQKLEHERQLLATVLENIEAGIVACDAEGRLNLFNRATRKFHNLPLEPLPPERWAEHYDLFKSDGTPMRTAEIPLLRALKEGQVSNIEMMIKPKSGGQVRFLLASGQAMLGAGGEKLGAVIAMQDITDQKQKEQALSAALREKETLLKEVYHRVKNNLQVITSLLNLQQRTLPEGQARAALREGTNRVRAMALVHEKLYQSGNLASIDLRDYVDDLCRRLGTAAGVDQRGITVICAVAPIMLGLDTAVPLGLLLNELISNSLKHGFPEGVGGEVRVRVIRQDAATVCLTVADNGVGLPADAQRGVTPTLGMKLVETLSRQLDGTLRFESAGGTQVTLLFPLREPVRDEMRPAQQDSPVQAKLK